MKIFLLIASIIILIHQGLVFADSKAKPVATIVQAAKKMDRVEYFELEAIELKIEKLQTALQLEFKTKAQALLERRAAIYAKWSIVEGDRVQEDGTIIKTPPKLTPISVKPPAMPNPADAKSVIPAKISTKK